jgi:hypothetical protein
MSKIVVSHNFKRLEALLTGLADKKAVQKAVARSIKRTLTSVRKTGAQEIRSKKLLKLKAAEAKQKVHAYDEAKPSKAVSEQYGKIWFGSKGESLGRFYARRVAAGRSQVVMRQNKEGGWQGVRLYRVKLNTYGQPYLKDPSRSFVVDRKGGKVVFARDPGAKRLPVQKLKGPGMADLVQQSGIIRRLQAVARNRYEREFDNNVKFYAEQALARARAIK